MYSINTKPGCYGDPDSCNQLDACSDCTHERTCSAIASNAYSANVNKTYNGGAYKQNYSNYTNYTSSWRNGWYHKSTTTQAQKNANLDAASVQRNKALIDPAIFVFDAEDSVARQFFTHVSHDVAHVTANRIVDLVNASREDYLRKLATQVSTENNNEES